MEQMKVEPKGRVSSHKESLEHYIENRRYKGITLSQRMDDESAFKDAVLSTAVSGLDVPVSAEELEAKLDAFAATEKMRVNSEPMYHVLADFTAIMDQTYRATNVVRSQAQVQSEALDIMLLTLSKDQKQVSRQYFYQLLKERAHGYREVPVDFDEKLDAIISRRKSENEKKSDEEKIEDAFSAYLGTLNQTEQMWRHNQKQQAEEYVKRDKLYDAVAAAEHIEATASEIDDMIRHIAHSCHIAVEEIAASIDTDLLAWQIRRDKARELIIKEAVTE